MRCLRKITDEQLTATVFLSKDNYDILDDELNKNFNMEIKDMKNPSSGERSKYKVRVLPPPRTIKRSGIWHEYSLTEKKIFNTVAFGFAVMDFSK